MKKLSVCVCPECGAEFVMETEDVERVVEVTCPLCEREFVPFVEDDGVDNEEEDQEAADDGQGDEEGEDIDEVEGEAEDDERGWPRLIARRRAKQSNYGQA